MIYLTPFGLDVTCLILDADKNMSRRNWDSSTISEGTGDEHRLEPSGALNQMPIRLGKGLFSYQIFVRAEAKLTVHNLRRETIDSSNTLRGSALELVA
jgi:hypothetical protein